MSVADEIIKGRFISIARSDLASTIYQSLTTRWSDVRVEFNNSIQSVSEQENGVLVTDAKGNAEVFDAVIGADGVHSHVRSLIFQNDAQYLTELGYYVAAFELDNYAHRDELTYVMHRDRKRSISRFSLRNNKTLFMFVFSADLISERPETDDAKRKIIHELCKDMEWEVPEIHKRIPEVDNIYFDGVIQTKMPQWHSGRVGLLGDASACPSLLAGEGTGLAMIEAYVLANELHKNQADVPAAFSAYEDVLSTFIQQKQKSALSSAAMFAPNNKFNEWVTNIGITMANIPVLAKMFAASSFEDKVDLPMYVSNSNDEA